MNAERCQRLVVVHGPADPILESTLVFVGLHVVHTGADVTVWAPIDLTLDWVVPSSTGWPPPDGCGAVASSQQQPFRIREETL